MIRSTEIPVINPDWSGVLRLTTKDWERWLDLNGVNVRVLFFHQRSVVWTVLLTLFLATSCLGPQIRTPWEKPGFERAEGGFQVYAEPGIDEPTVNQSLQDLSRIKDELQLHYFPTFQGRTFRVILYKDRKSYESFRPVKIDSVADYERNRNTLNLPVHSDRTVWKHEMIHAMLESVRPQSPFWLNEGLAYFIMFQKFDAPPGCQAPMVASLPPNFPSYIPRILEKPDLKPGSDFDFTRTEEIELNSVLSTYFVLYLWKKQLLIDLLMEYQKNPEISAEFILTGGNVGKWKKMQHDFRVWLAGMGPLQEIPGC